MQIKNSIKITVIALTAAVSSTIISSTVSATKFDQGTMDMKQFLAQERRERQEAERLRQEAEMQRLAAEARLREVDPTKQGH